MVLLVAAAELDGRAGSYREVSAGARISYIEALFCFISLMVNPSRENGNLIHCSVVCR